MTTDKRGDFFMSLIFAHFELREMRANLFVGSLFYAKPTNQKCKKNMFHHVLKEASNITGCVVELLKEGKTRNKFKRLHLGVLCSLPLHSMFYCV